MPRTDFTEGSQETTSQVDSLQNLDTYPIRENRQGIVSNSKFAGARNEAGWGTTEPGFFVINASIDNGIRLQKTGAGGIVDAEENPQFPDVYLEGSNYVYGRFKEGNFVAPGTNPEVEAVYFNPMGQNDQNDCGLGVYGLFDKQITGKINHGFYTHNRNIRLGQCDIESISVLKQSILTAGCDSATEVYGTSTTEQVSLIPGLPRITDSDSWYFGTKSDNYLLDNAVTETEYRLDVASTLGSDFGTNYIYIGTDDDNQLGEKSFNLGGMYDLYIEGTDESNPFSCNGNDFNGINDNNGPIIEGKKIERNTTANSSSDPIDFKESQAANDRFYTPRLVVNNTGLLTSTFDINVGVGQTSSRGFVDTNSTNAITGGEDCGVVKFAPGPFQAAVGDTIGALTTVYSNPLANKKLRDLNNSNNTLVTNTPNTMPGEILNAYITLETGSTFFTENKLLHAVKIPVTPCGLHLGGLGLRGLVLIAKRILENKGVSVTGADYGVRTQGAVENNGSGTAQFLVDPSGTDNTKFARLIAGMFNKFNDGNSNLQKDTIDDGAQNAVLEDAKSLEDAFDNDNTDFLGSPLDGNNSAENKYPSQGTTLGRRAYNTTYDDGNRYTITASGSGPTLTFSSTASGFIEGASVTILNVTDSNLEERVDGTYVVRSVTSGSGNITVTLDMADTTALDFNSNSKIFLEGNPNANNTNFDQYLAGVAGVFKAAGVFESKTNWETLFAAANPTSAWMNATSSSGAGARTTVFPSGFTLPTAVDSQNMGELVRALFDYHSLDLLQYLGVTWEGLTEDQGGNTFGIVSPIQAAMKFTWGVTRGNDTTASSRSEIWAANLIDSMAIGASDLEYQWTATKPGLLPNKGTTKSDLPVQTLKDGWSQSVRSIGTLNNNKFNPVNLDDATDRQTDYNPHSYFNVVPSRQIKNYYSESDTANATATAVPDRGFVGKGTWGVVENQTQGNINTLTPLNPYNEAGQTSFTNAVASVGDNLAGYPYIWPPTSVDRQAAEANINSEASQLKRLEINQFNTTRTMYYYANTSDFTNATDNRNYLGEGTLNILSGGVLL